MDQRFIPALLFVLLALAALCLGANCATNYDPASDGCLGFISPTVYLDGS